MGNRGSQLSNLSRTFYLFHQQHIPRQRGRFAPLAYRTDEVIIGALREFFTTAGAVPPVTDIGGFKQFLAITVEDLYAEGGNIIYGYRKIIVNAIAVGCKGLGDKCGAIAAAADGERAFGN